MLKGKASLGSLSDMRVHYSSDGKLAQMVERSLSMREVPGSIPGFSTCFNVIY